MNKNRIIKIAAVVLGILLVALIVRVAGPALFDAILALHGIR
jgi:multisubunit Na+/H+ antiporter MnhF subunit